MLVLGIETSCDETGVAIYDSRGGLLAEALHSQIDLHKVYGGVVPELASRDHVQRLPLLVEQVLLQAGLQRQQLDAVAYTAGPGLAGALLVGASYAIGLARALGVQAIGVHHMEGHLLAPLLDIPAPEPPFVALLVSGGHSQLVEVSEIGRYRLLGDTLDDAAGEAFDKTAKLLGLSYPGGPAIARLAESGNPNRFAFPRPMTDRPGLDFSFSGLKTFTRNVFQQNPVDDSLAADVAAGFQQAVCETLTIKCRRALKQTRMNRLIVAGGVSANRLLRQHLDAMAETLGAQVFYPPPAFCTDNGAMIALAGALRLEAGLGCQQPSGFSIHPRWPMTELAALPEPPAQVPA